MTIYNTRDLRAEFAPDGESSPSEQAANAKLLLAAPAMLAALKTAVELLGRVDSADPICDDWRNGNQHVRNSRCDKSCNLCRQRLNTTMKGQHMYTHTKFPNKESPHKGR